MAESEEPENIFEGASFQARLFHYSIHGNRLKLYIAYASMDIASLTKYLTSQNEFAYFRWYTPFFLVRLSIQSLMVFMRNGYHKW